MKYLAFMTRTDGPRPLYLLWAYLATVAGTIVFATLAVLLFPTPQTAGEAAAPPPFFGLVIVWPLISTLMVWGVVAGTRRITPTYWHAAGLATAAFIVFFSLIAGIQGGMIFAWPYFMFCLTFLAWQLKSNLDGFVMTFLLQAAVNFLPAVLMMSQAD
ncbi:hypothetical protein [Hyphomonas johnsonii]|uniref:Uncharacterized protein n=1 Tax=Hyphomonas johnsonii MHS-2 TaxID=1280950 RepID=A0A059FP22_9PROT|nr:hypothetical protein [Hyphomonas johnsonii]KCZ92415.1 hypothetical protein HJO_10279 [Hyphomonas johnsonii MHS-2]